MWSILGKAFVMQWVKNSMMRMRMITVMMEDDDGVGGDGLSPLYKTIRKKQVSKPANK